MEVEVKAAKALLQQHCQKKGMPPPRFEKREVGGQRGPTPGQRYSVTLEAPVLSGPRKKGARRPAPRSFSLREADDGWDTVQDAQNAAATLALFKVLNSSPFPMHTSKTALSPNFPFSKPPSSQTAVSFQLPPGFWLNVGTFFLTPFPQPSLAQDPFPQSLILRVPIPLTFSLLLL